MSLIVQLSRIENLVGKGQDRIGLLTFRNHQQWTKVIPNALVRNHNLEFDEKFEWNGLGSNIDPSEVLDISIYNVAKFSKNKLVAKFRMVMQRLLIDGKLNICDTILDNNNKELESLIHFTVEYQAIDGTVGDWKMEEFGKKKMSVKLPKFETPKVQGQHNFRSGSALRGNLRGSRRNLDVQIAESVNHPGMVVPGMENSNQFGSMVIPQDKQGAVSEKLGSRRSSISSIFSKSRERRASAPAIHLPKSLNLKKSTSKNGSMYAIDEMAESPRNSIYEQSVYANSNHPSEPYSSEPGKHQPNRSSIAITIGNNSTSYEPDNASVSGTHMSRSQSYFQANLPKSRSGSVYQDHISLAASSMRGSVVMQNNSFVSSSSAKFDENNLSVSSHHQTYLKSIEDLTQQATIYENIRAKQQAENDSERPSVVLEKEQLRANIEHLIHQLDGQPEDNFNIVAQETDSLEDIGSILGSLADSSIYVGESVTNKRNKPDITFGPRTDKPVHFQVQIKVIEAKKLSGNEMDPVCMVRIEDNWKYTQPIKSSNNPNWDEGFVFEYNEAENVVFDKIILFQVYTSKNLLKMGSLIGQFKIDVRTIYQQPEHQYLKKWATLTEPNDSMGVKKGSLKLDLVVLAKGDVASTIKCEDNDIPPENLIMPLGMEIDEERPRAKFVFKIYKAEGLPKMGADFTGKLKSTLLGETRDYCDSYIEIDFCGQKGQTSVRKSDYSPYYCEQISFTELFPPLCCRARVRLKDNSSTLRGADTIGTHFIDFSQICRPKIAGDKGFPPTFGPSFVNLYGSHRSYKYVNEYHHLNLGINEGVAFRGRLLISVEVKEIEMAEEEEFSPAVKVERIPELSVYGAGKNEEFLLFSTILEASMIDKDLGEKNISFEISMGNYGNQIDGVNKSSVKDRVQLEEESSDESDDSDNDESSKLVPPVKVLNPAVLEKQFNEVVDFGKFSTTVVEKPKTIDKQYYSVFYKIIEC